MFHILGSVARHTAYVLITSELFHLDLSSLLNTNMQLYLASEAQPSCYGTAMLIVRLRAYCHSFSVI